MKHNHFRLLAGLCLALLVSPTWAQVKLPTTKRTTGITAYANNTNLTVVGDSGLVLYSADAGRTWLPDTSATTQNLRRVTSGIAAGNWKRFAVGDSGTFMFSDGGPTNKTRWREIATGTRMHLNAVQGSGNWYGGDAMAVGDSGTVLVWRNGAGIIFRGRVTTENLISSYQELLSTAGSGIERVTAILGATNGKAYLMSRTNTAYRITQPDTSLAVTEFNFDSLTTAPIVRIARPSYNGDFYFFAADGTVIRGINVFTASTRSFRNVSMVNNNNCGPVLFSAAVGVGQAWNVSWAIGAGAGGKLIALSPGNNNGRWLCSNIGSTSTIVSLYATQPSNSATVLAGITQDGTFFSSNQQLIAPAGIKASAPTTFCKGETITLSDTSANQYSYQWFRNGVPVVSATASTIAVRDSGTYTLRRRILDFMFNYNNNGSPTTFYGPDTLSNGIRVSYLPAPTQPVIVPVGSDSLSAPVAGTTRYRWFRDNTLVGDTTSGYRPTQTGRYRVVAYNNIGCGSDTSATYNFFICTEIGRALNRTRDTAICRGQNVSLRYTPAPGVTPAYQWFRNDVPLTTGGNAASLTVTDSGSYYVRLLVNNCLLFSDTILVDVDAVPTAQALPISGTQTICGGDSLVVEAPAGFARYRWFVGTGNNPTLYKDTVANRLVLRQVVNTLRVRVLTGAGCTSPLSSNSVTTTLAPLMPTSINYVNDTTICQGNNLLLRYTAPTGVNNIRYQWFRNATAVPTGGTNNLLTVTDSGAYQLRVVVGTCTTFTNTFRLGLAPVPSVPTLTVATTNTICSGDSLVVEAPTGFARYRWVTGTTGTTIFKDTTASRLVLRTAVSGLRLRVGNAQGCFSQPSAPFNTTLGTTPAKPGLSLNNGIITATVTPSVPGAFYRWFLDGVLISGQIGATLTATVSGTYTAVAVSNTCVSDTSDPLNVVSLANKLLTGSMVLQPNPASDKVVLALDDVPAQNATLTITDLQGRLLSSTAVVLQAGSLRHELDLNQMAKGMYLVTVTTSAGGKTQRLVVQ